jgi:hypothetical protein
METLAPNLCTSANAIERIERLATQLGSGLRVRVTLRDANVVTGVVAELPVVQLFRDAQGNEGMNGVARLEDPQVPLWTVYLWLDDMEKVERLDVP